MSTFDGIVKEFPDIRIDRFTANDTAGTRPLAYFLSHVHTDHLVGLEGINGPFVYCSPATREILLRLEKYPHRMNFATGILEQRVVRYKRLKKLLKAVPLETPTTIELAGNRTIRVTLFDANHCIGAVMFLVEDESNAILYTGDIRSEMWWVNTLIRNPLLLPYVAAVDHEPLQRLDAIYLDTTFASKADPYREFPPKASGVMELLRKIKDYPEDTLFYFDAWTYGYEEVLQALSTFLRCQVHVDDYRWRIYSSLTQSDELCDAKVRASEAPKLVGYQCGNHAIKGCLTTEQTRIHSCERGTGCNIWNKQFVRITPIISRHAGKDMPELGAGGGHGDLNQQHELEVFDDASISALMKICVNELQDQPHLLSGVIQMLTQAMEHPRKIISLDATDLSQDEDVFEEMDELPLDGIPAALAKRVAKMRQSANGRTSTAVTSSGLPKQITFPYSRHSSFGELCLLLEAFKPKDIFPCTVEKKWTANMSMGYLFGHLYNEPPIFRHDQLMLQNAEELANEDRVKPASRNRYSQNTQEYELVVASAARSRQVSPSTSRRRSADEAENDAVESAPKRRKASASDDRESRLENYDYSSDLGRRSRGRSDAADEQRPRNSQGAAKSRRQNRRRRSSLRQPEDYGRLSPHAGESASIDSETWNRPGVPGDRRLKISNLPVSMSEGSLQAFFTSQGFRLTDISVPTSNTTGSENQHAFADVRTAAEAQNAIKRLNGTSFKGRTIRVRLANMKAMNATSSVVSENNEAISTGHAIINREGRGLYIGNLQPCTSVDRLKDFFARNGFELTDVTIPKHSNGQPRDFGFANVSSCAEAERVIREMDDVRLDGRRISIELAGKGSQQEDPSSATGQANAECSQDNDDTEHSQSVKAELDDEQLRLGLKIEAYAAALGEGELTWSEVGLVSVNGHQEKEEEL